jgi:hypothetical protein
VYIREMRESFSIHVTPFRRSNAPGRGATTVCLCVERRSLSGHGRVWNVRLKLGSHRETAKGGTERMKNASKSLENVKEEISREQ